MPTAQIREVSAAHRLANVRYAIREMAVIADKLAREGRKILPLNIGDPLSFDFATPPHMIDAVHKAMRDGRNGYGPSPGTDEALAAIRREAERKGIRSVQSVFVTQGVSEAVDACLAALVNRGENLLTPRPDYPMYSAVLARLEIPLYLYDLNEDDAWQPDLEDIRKRIAPQTRGLVLINPNNPTGAVYSRKMLEAIAELARQNNLVVFADEIYDKLILDDEPHVAFASVAPDVPCVTFGGLSKNYLAPGWRIGWGIVSGDEQAVKPFVEGIHKLLRARLCANTPMQAAIPAALDGPQDHLVDVRHRLRSRRDVTMQWCRNEARVSCVSPRGAFYAFPRLDIPEGDDVFCKELLQKTNVLTVYGSGFGQRAGTKHLRIVFLPNEAILASAYQAISGFLRERYS
jgi:alanine-synthesizing transaminase